MQETQVRSLGGKDLLEKRMATHSCILAWRIPWIEEPGGLQFMGLQRVGHSWMTNIFSHTYTYFAVLHGKWISLTRVLTTESPRKSFLKKVFSFLAMPYGMWDLSSLTKCWTRALRVKCGALTTGLPGKFYHWSLKNVFSPSKSWLRYFWKKRDVAWWLKIYTHPL